MSTDAIRCAEVSKFYGEVLGVNRVTVSIGAGITSLVGPNGSGKTTLMNMITGLLRPTRGTIEVLGATPDEPERLLADVGYCTQFDSFPRGDTGLRFLSTWLGLHGYEREAAAERAWELLERVGLTAAARRRIAGYSKGMRQRVKLAQALAHDPKVVLLDEPLNGLDPMARAETIALFRQMADEGRAVVISSHILHEVDLISDRVILINGGYVVAEGSIRAVRSEISAHPMQLLIRCDRPRELAVAAFGEEGTVEARLVDDDAVLIKTSDADAFTLALNRIVVDLGLRIDAVLPVDEDVEAVYDYLIGGEESTR